MHQTAVILIVLTNNHTAYSLRQDHKKSGLIQAQGLRGACLYPFNNRCHFTGIVCSPISEWRDRLSCGFTGCFNDFVDRSPSNQIYEFDLLPKSSNVEQSQVPEDWPPRSRFEDSHIRINSPLLQLQKSIRSSMSRRFNSTKKQPTNMRVCYQIQNYLFDADIFCVAPSGN